MVSNKNVASCFSAILLFFATSFSLKAELHAAQESLSVSSASNESQLVKLVVCKSPGKITMGASSGKAVRMLRVYKQEGDAGCVATYSKTNVEKTVGAARTHSQCQSILEGIRKNLESSQWACKEAASPKVLKSAQAKAAEDAEREQAEEASLERELN